MSKVEIETDCAEFLKSIENWDGQHPPFREIVASAIVQAFRCFRADEFRKRLVDESGFLMGSAPARYAAGVSAPHPLMQKSLVEEIAKLIKELDETHREEQASAIAFMRSIGNSPDD